MNNKGIIKHKTANCILRELKNASSGQVSYVSLENSVTAEFDDKPEAFNEVMGVKNATEGALRYLESCGYIKKAVDATSDLSTGEFFELTGEGWKEVEKLEDMICKVNALSLKDFFTVAYRSGWDRLLKACRFLLKVWNLFKGKIELGLGFRDGK